STTDPYPENPVVPDPPVYNGGSTTDPYPENPVVPDPPVYNGGNEGGYWGDPHFTGFDGEKYDVHGVAGNTYNILSDKDVQYNARFDAWGNQGATAIGQAGIRVGSDMLVFDAKTGVASLNSQTLKTGDKAALSAAGSSFAFNGNNLNVVTSEYTIDLTRENNDHFQSNVILNGNPLADGVNPHGILGQTADGNGVARDGNGWFHENGLVAAKEQGGGVLDKVNADGSITTAAKDDSTVSAQYQVSSIDSLSTIDAAGQQFIKFAATA
ncbi:MAG: hypothetical protein AB7P76_10920, partial [Candidatus Melainabacteria bacterium]